MCALLVGLPDVLVLGVVDEADGPLRVHVETIVGSVGCAGCGTRARVKDRAAVVLVDLPAFGRPAVLVWHKRRWRCPDTDCATGTWTEQAPAIAAARARVTDRASRWVCGQVGRDGRSVSEVARELGCDWHTVMDAVVAYGTPLVDDPDRIGQVNAMGLDETLFARTGAWRTQSWCTSVVDVGSPSQLLDVVEGRTAKAASAWIDARSEAWRNSVAWATLDLSGPYRKAFNDSLPDARQVADPMLLLLSSSDCGQVGGREEPVDIAGDVALETAHGASTGLALADALVDVGARCRVPSEANHDDAPQRHVGVPVAAAVEPVPVLFARGAVQRRHPTERGEGCFAAKSLGVVARSDHERGRDVRTHALELEQPGRGRSQSRST